MNSISCHILFLVLRNHQVVMNDSCFTYSSCLFPFLDLQIFFSLMFVPGFDKALRYLTCVGNFPPPQCLLRKKKIKGNDSIPKPSFIPWVEGLHLLHLRSLLLFPFTVKLHEKTPQEYQMAMGWGAASGLTLAILGRKRLPNINRLLALSFHTSRQHHSHTNGWCWGFFSFP